MHYFCCWHTSLPFIFSLPTKCRINLQLTHHKYSWILVLIFEYAWLLQDSENHTSSKTIKIKCIWPAFSVSLKIIHLRFVLKIYTLYSTYWHYSFVGQGPLCQKSWTLVNSWGPKKMFSHNQLWFSKSSDTRSYVKKYDIHEMIICVPWLKIDASTPQSMQCSPLPFYLLSISTIALCHICLIQIDEWNYLN